MAFKQRIEQAGRSNLLGPDIASELSHKLILDRSSLTFPLPEPSAVVLSLWCAPEIQFGIKGRLDMRDALGFCDLQAAPGDARDTNLFAQEKSDIKMFYVSQWPTAMTGVRSRRE
ncbi:hypothetical protein ONV78_13920 [Hahella sp. CR1]|uniref:hypothetical protein n=1 Tax=Hahella sp. CR1 TaxID=2992807 RepID=UPI00244197B4|nr:hypothetical protein [Hahella sp. CR1]MDG9668836.1 hypothetical protein [Hahella sp. CR1]